MGVARLQTDRPPLSSPLPTFPLPHFIFPFSPSTCSSHTSQVGADDDTLPIGVMGDYRLSCLQAVRVLSSMPVKRGETSMIFVAINRLVMVVLTDASLLALGMPTCRAQN